MGPTPLRTCCHFYPRSSCLIFRLFLLPLPPASRSSGSPGRLKRLVFSLAGVHVFIFYLLELRARVRFFKRFIQLASGTLIWSWRMKGHHQIMGSRRHRRKLRRPSRRLPLLHLARSLVRSLAWIDQLALARVPVLHPPLVAMKVAVRVVGVMSK
jgi:hypothetical protein